MMPGKPIEFGVATLAVTQSVVAFTAFLPKFTDVGKADKDAVTGEVRLGETAAVVISLSIGGLLSWLTDSSVPFYVAGIMTFVLVALYETALRKDV